MYWLFLSQILKDAQFILLWCATPAAVVQGDTQEAFITYFKVQYHESLADYLHNKMVEHQQHYIQAQVIHFSNNKYSDTCLNRNLNDAKFCIKRTLNKLSIHNFNL